MIPEDSFFEVRLAQSEQDLLAAQRLRYEVFVEELGGDGPLVDHDLRLERDHKDDYYDHLLLIDRRRPDISEPCVVGVYRLLRGDRAVEAGGFYTADEYDLAPLLESGRRLLELGRSCLHPDYRGGTGLYRLWSGLAAYVEEHDSEVMFGVASFHGTDVDALAQPLSLLHQNHLAPPEFRVRALPEGFAAMDRLPATAIDRLAAAKAIPPLIKSYLRLGGFVGEGAFIDKPFNTTDVCLVMETSRIDARQRAIYGGGRS